jgi:hypothetical protein
MVDQDLSGLSSLHSSHDQTCNVDRNVLCKGCRQCVMSFLHRPQVQFATPTLHALSYVNTHPTALYDLPLASCQIYNRQAGCK